MCLQTLNSIYDSTCKYTVFHLLCTICIIYWSDAELTARVGDFYCSHCMLFLLKTSFLTILCLCIVDCLVTGLCIGVDFAKCYWSFSLTMTNGCQSIFVCHYFVILHNNFEDRITQPADQNKNS